MTGDESPPRQRASGADAFMALVGLVIAVAFLIVSAAMLVRLYQWVWP